VLLPTLFVGTDDFKMYGGKKHWGMEMFARTTLPGSLYLREATFRALVDDFCDFLERQGFRLAVFFTGHEAGNQRRILQRAETARKKRRLNVQAWWSGKVPHPPELERDGGHAGADETSELMAVDRKLA